MAKRLISCINKFDIFNRYKGYNYYKNIKHHPNNSFINSYSISTHEFLSEKYKSEATLYVHWPFCESRCSYCNFNKYIDKNVDEKQMTRALIKEFHSSMDVSSVNEIKSIFFGGGTPSLASSDVIRNVIDAVSPYLRRCAEITIEVNPNERHRLKEYADIGVNRVSLGIQALNDCDLSILGRQHNKQDALEAISEAKLYFPGRVSLDYIFGRPSQTLDQLNDELNELICLADHHISLYQLTLERGTKLFGQVMDRQLMMPVADKMADFYEKSVEVLENKGFHRYEVSNFAKTTDAESTHNKSYWNATQYIGIGPGAHSRFALAEASGAAARWRRVQTLEPLPWLREVNERGHATRLSVAMTTDEILHEVLMMGLRTTEGIENKTWATFSPEHSLQDIFSSKLKFKSLIQADLVELNSRGLRATHKGLKLIDAFIPDLMNILDSHFSLECDEKLDIKNNY